MSIYKDCDIRGIYGQEFDEREILLVGRAIGRRLEGRSIVVAGDVRVSTQVVKEQLMAGLKEEGAHIIDIGIAPTPVAYFAKSMACFDAYALAIVTASHNPAKYNGIKLMFGDYPPTPDEIKRIEADVKYQSKDVDEWDKGKISCMPITEVYDVEARYTAYIGQLVGRTEGLKVVLDMGNGTTAGIAPRIYRELGYEVVELFGEPDGRFPNRNPNPADFKNLDAVRAKVLETGADFGVAFDGDGDRAVFIDNKGRAVINEKALIMLTERATVRSICPAESVCNDKTGVDREKFSVVYDQKCSKIVPDAIESMGGKAILERSGHAFIKKTFLKNASILAGEISGHFFFRELGHDDGIYAGLCMGDYIAHIGYAGCTYEGRAADHKMTDTMMSGRKATLAELADRLPDPHISPDLRYRVPYDKMDNVLARMKEHYEALGMPISTYDGVRVSLPDGWLLVRKSVTEEAMTAKIEAKNEARLDEIIRELEENYFEGN